VNRKEEQETPVPSVFYAKHQRRLILFLVRREEEKDFLPKGKLEKPRKMYVCTWRHLNKED